MVVARLIGVVVVVLAVAVVVVRTAVVAVIAVTGVAVIAAVVVATLAVAIVVAAAGVTKCFACYYKTFGYSTHLRPSSKSTAGKINDERTRHRALAR